MRVILLFLSSLLVLLFPTLAFAAVDSDYESAGEQMMDQMMGSQHEQADESIKDTMGEDFLKQMHVAMGKMAERNISGNNSLGMMPMMGVMMGGGGFNMMGGNFGGMMGGNFGIYAILAWLTWTLIIVALVLVIVWLWKQIQKK